MEKKKKVVVVCAVVGLLGLISAATGFAAEGTRMKESNVQKTRIGAPDHISPAFALGLTAGVALVIAQAIISCFAGCICCKKRQNARDTTWMVALISFIISWITFAIAISLLFLGTVLNLQEGAEGRYCYADCVVVWPGVFAGGTLLSLASISLGIVYYITLSKSKALRSMDGAAQPNDQGIAIGQPVVPPQSNQPVFVHEDTYNRRQFP